MQSSESKTPDYDKSGYLIGRLFFGHIKPYMKRLFLAVFFMIIVAATTAATAWIMQPVIDDIFLNKNSNLLVIVSVSLFVVFAVKGLATYGQNYIMQCLGQRIIINMQIELYRHMLYSDLKLMTKESSGKVISRFVNDINILRNSVVILTTGFAKEIITLILLVSLMFYQSVTLSIITFTAFPIAIYPLMKLSRRMRKISNGAQEQLGEFTNHLDETFKSVRVIKAYQQEKFEIKRSRNIIEGVYKLFKKAARNQSAASPMMEMIGGGAVAMVVWYGGSQVIDGVTTPGKFISFITAVMAAYKPAKSLSGMSTILQDGLAAAKRLFILLDDKPTIADSKNAVDLPSNSSALSVKFKDVEFGYSSKKKALSKLSFEAKSGQSIALVGTSGGGKSTVMNLLLRFYDVDKGSITVGGKDIKDIKISSLRQNISYVGQEVMLFDDTIAANIAYGKENATLAEIKAAAKAAAAHDFIEELADGYNTKVGSNGFSLSGGQRQRISIARALIRDCKILLLDEATSALDSISEKQIQTALANLMKGRTSIVIAHRLSTIEKSDMIYVIKSGKLVESGEHAVLLAKNGAYTRLHKGMENLEG